MSPPKLAVDIIAFRNHRLVLVERKHEPFGFALPGGMVKEGETLEQAAARELEEETGLHAHDLAQFHTYSDPDRDPRWHVVTQVFSCTASGTPRQGDDAASVKEVDAEELEKLKARFAFDHYQIIEDFLRKHAEELD